MTWFLLLLACGGSEAPSSAVSAPATRTAPTDQRAPAVQEATEEPAQEAVEPVTEQTPGNPGGGEVGRAKPKERESTADPEPSENTVGRAVPKEREGEDEQELVREGGDETQIKQ